MRILVVEDDAATRSALCEYLAAAGYRVRTAGSGGEGLAALQGSSDVDAVLLDLVMPDMDGFELLRRHREAGGRATPISCLMRSAVASPISRLWLRRM